MQLLVSCKRDSFFISYYSAYHQDFLSKHQRRVIIYCSVYIPSTIPDVHPLCETIGFVLANFNYVSLQHQVLNNCNIPKLSQNYGMPLFMLLCQNEPYYIIYNMISQYTITCVELWCSNQIKSNQLFVMMLWWNLC